jgi:hypothetical protein
MQINDQLSAIEKINDYCAGITEIKNDLIALVLLFREFI